MLKNKIFFCLLFIFSIFINTAFAFKSTVTTPAKQTISITADQAEFHRAENYGIFTGHVLLVEASGRLSADKLTIFVDNNHQLTRAIAIGKPALYFSQAANNKPQTVAIAEHMDYNKASHSMTLTNNAKVQQGDNRLEGNHIIYDLLNKTVISKHSPHEKTTIIIKQNDKSSGITF